MTSSRVPFVEAMKQMEELVRKGEMIRANHVGSEADIPLSINKNEIQDWESLSQGAESHVYMGIMADAQVAVKKPIIRNWGDLVRFRQEMMMLHTLKHENIMPLLGARMLPPDYFMVMPHMGDNLHTLIHEKGWKPSWDEILNIGIQLATAVQAVHRAGIVHRDIKLRNIMTGNGKGIQLADFGVAAWLSKVEIEEVEPERAVFSRGKPTGGFHKTRIVGTLEYMAPEILLKQPFSHASDVYAFAITLNELVTGVYPFSDCTKENPDCHTVLEMGYGRQELSTAVAAEGLRPTLPRGCSKEYSILMSKCWSVNPSFRPAVNDIVQALKGMKADTNAYPQRSTHMSAGIAPCLVENVSLPQTFAHEPVRNPCVSVKALPLNNQLEPMTLFPNDVRSEYTRGEKSPYLPVISMGGYGTAGMRGEDRMEDRHLLKNSFMGDSNAKLLGIYDGHRGSETAQFASKEISDILTKCIMDLKDPELAFKQAYLQLESMFEASGLSSFPDPKGTRYPGCTALSALIWQDELFLANSGDCRGVVCREGRAIQITNDHTAMNAVERKRIEGCGAQVRWIKDSWRVGNAGIQVTRSLGDVDLKSAGVIAEPEISVVHLTEKDEFLIMASDGLWDTVSNDEAVAIVQDTVKHPEMSAQRLATEAVARGSHDNVSVIIVYLQPVSTVEQIYKYGESTQGCRARSYCNVEARQSSYALSADEMIDTC